MRSINWIPLYPFFGQLLGFLCLFGLLRNQYGPYPLGFCKNDGSAVSAIFVVDLFFQCAFLSSPFRRGNTIQNISRMETVHNPSYNMQRRVLRRNLKPNIKLLYRPNVFSLSPLLSPQLRNCKHNPTSCSVHKHHSKCRKQPHAPR